MPVTIRPMASMWVATITEGRGGCAGAVPQPVQRAEFAAADFMNERPPFIFDDFGSRILVTGKAGSGNQVFEKGKDIGHGLFRSAST